MHAAAVEGLQPDLTMLLLPDLATSLFRARRRNTRHVQQSGTDENRFEREGDEFYARIHEAFERIAAREPERVVAIRQDAASTSSSSRSGRWCGAAGGGGAMKRGRQPGGPWRMPPGLKRSLPFYAFKPWVKLGEPILLFEHLLRTYRQHLRTTSFWGRRSCSSTTRSTSARSS